MYEKDGFRLAIAPKWLKNACEVKDLDTGKVTMCPMNVWNSRLYIWYLGAVIYLDEVEWEG